MAGKPSDAGTALSSGFERIGRQGGFEAWSSLVIETVERAIQDSFDHYLPGDDGLRPVVERMESGLDFSAGECLVTKFRSEGESGYSSIVLLTPAAVPWPYRGSDEDRRLFVYLEGLVLGRISPDAEVRKKIGGLVDHHQRRLEPFCRLRLRESSDLAPGLALGTCVTAQAAIPAVWPVGRIAGGAARRIEGTLSTALTASFVEGYWQIIHLANHLDDELYEALLQGEGGTDEFEPHVAARAADLAVKG